MGIRVSILPTAMLSCLNYISSELHTEPCNATGMLSCLN